MTLKDLEILKNNLPKNYSRLLAEKHSVSTSFVNMVLAGTRNSDEIIESGILLAETYKKSRKVLASKIKAL